MVIKVIYRIPEIMYELPENNIPIQTNDLQINEESQNKINYKCSLINDKQNLDIDQLKTENRSDNLENFNKFMYSDTILPIRNSQVNNFMGGSFEQPQMLPDNYSLRTHIQMMTNPEKVKSM